MFNMNWLIVVSFLTYISKLNSSSKSIADPYTYVISGEHIIWPSKIVRRLYSSSGRYETKNIIPSRFQARGLYAVLTFPRLKPGVPITLGRIRLLPNLRVPDIHPFPSWELNEEGHPKAIQNAVDVFLDEKSILWVLDTGTINTLVQPEQIGPPRVLGINFVTGKVKYDIDVSCLTTATSNLQYVTAENSLGRPYVYVSDADTCSVIVWDVKNGNGKRVDLPHLVPRGDGALYMALLRPPFKNLLMVFSHASHPALFGIELPALRRGLTADVREIGEKKCESVILGSDNGSKLFFRWRDDATLRVWDIARQNSGSSVISWEPDQSRTSTQISGGSRLLTWSLESNFQDFIKGEVGKVGPSAVLKPLVKDHF